MLNTFGSVFLVKNIAFKYYLIGLEVENGNYNQWKWADSHAYTYNNWANGNPQGNFLQNEAAKPFLGKCS